jgi:hypothetical protein
MHVWVMFHFLIPGVQHAEEADLCAEMFRITSDLDQRRSGGTEEQVVYGFLVLECKRRQETRECENDMNVARGKQFLTTRLDPTFPGVGLAFWAMPIAA